MPHTQKKILDAKPEQAFIPMPRVGPGVKTDTDAKLDEIIRLLTVMSDESPIENQQTGTASFISEGITKISAQSVIENQGFQIQPSRQISFVKIPPGLTRLLVRLNHADGAEIDILEAGRTIKRKNVIDKIFIAAEPAITNAADNDIHVLSGQTEVGPFNRNKDYNKSIPLQFSARNLGVITTLDLSGLAPLSPVVFSVRDLGLGATGTHTLWDNIPSSVPIRIKTRIYVWLTDATTKMTALTRLHDAGTVIQEDAFIMHQDFGFLEFDTEWFQLALNDDNSTFDLVVSALGPVGQEYSYSSRLWLIP